MLRAVTSAGRRRAGSVEGGASVPSLRAAAPGGPPARFGPGPPAVSGPADDSTVEAGSCVPPLQAGRPPSRRAGHRGLPTLGAAVAAATAGDGGARSADGLRWAGAIAIGAASGTSAPDVAGPRGRPGAAAASRTGSTRLHRSRPGSRRPAGALGVAIGIAAGGGCAGRGCVAGRGRLAGRPRPAPGRTWPPWRPRRRRRGVGRDRATDAGPDLAGHEAGVEAVLDDPQGQEVIALLGQDPAEAGEVVLVELPVAGGRALGVEQALALEEADLRDRDVGELVLQQGEHLADRQVRALVHEIPAAAEPAMNTSLNLPICTSSPPSNQASSTRRRFTYVPLSDPTSRTW